MFDKQAFFNLVETRGVKITSLSKALGISTATLYRKVNGKSDFTRTEIQKCCDFFALHEMNDIFFANEVS